MRELRQRGRVIVTPMSMINADVPQAESCDLSSSPKMKYWVMPTARRGHSSIEIAAPPDIVYDLIADVTRMGEWSPECYRCEWLDGASAAAPGARFRGYNRRGPLRWERTAVVDTADRGREFSFTTVNDGAGREETRWRYVMEPSSSGTVLTEAFQFLWCSVPNRLAEALMPRGRQVNQGIEETLRRIKQAAETLA